MSDLVKQYDEGTDWLFRSFGEWEFAVRRKLASFVYGKVLEIGCGTGRGTLALAARCSHLTLTDALPEMIEEAERVGGADAYQACDAHQLPFQDNEFDCVFTFGGFNTFQRPWIAMREIDRVSRDRVVMGDEGLAPWLRETDYGRTLIKANPLYLNKPPLELIPLNAQNVQVHWILGNAFYVLTYTKGKIPKLDLDLPIPGVRGGTLRSRYESV